MQVLVICFGLEKFKMLLFLANLLVVSCIRPDLPVQRNHVVASVNAPATISEIPLRTSKQSVVSNLLTLADVEEKASFLTRLTEFPDRYFKSDNGVKAAEWIVIFL